MISGTWELDPSSDAFESNYYLYRAEDDGEAEDEPAMSWNTYVTATDCDSFSLSLNSSAFIAVTPNLESTVQTRATSENVAVPEIQPADQMKSGLEGALQIKK